MLKRPALMLPALLALAIAALAAPPAGRTQPAPTAALAFPGAQAGRGTRRAAVADESSG